MARNSGTVYVSDGLYLPNLLELELFIKKLNGLMSFCHVGQVLERFFFQARNMNEDFNFKKRWVEIKSSSHKGDEATLYSFPALTSMLERVRCCSYFPLSPTFTSCRGPRHSKNYDVKNDSIDLKDVKTV